MRNVSGAIMKEIHWLMVCKPQLIMHMKFAQRNTIHDFPVPRISPSILLYSLLLLTLDLCQSKRHVEDAIRYHLNRSKYSNRPHPEPSFMYWQRAEKTP